MEDSKKDKKKSKRTKNTPPPEGDDDFDEIQTGVIIHKPSDTCKTIAVTIFSDRAEVTRRIEGTVEVRGIHEVHVHGLPDSIQADTFRISGGIGSIVLMEVTCDTSNVEISENEKSEKEKRKDVIVKEMNEIDENIKT